MLSRRRILQMSAAASALAAGAWALLAPARGNAYYQGPVSDHFDGERFFNPGGIEPRGRVDFLYLHVGEPRTSHAKARLGFKSTPHIVLLRADGTKEQEFSEGVDEAALRQALDKLARGRSQ